MINKSNLDNENNVILSKFDSKKFKLASKKSFNAIKNSFPILLGVILLISLLSFYLDSFSLSSFFSGITFIDTFLGSFFGSVLAGNPITSYIIGGELLNSGVSLYVVTSFIVSWVTVGIVQFPAESILLGKKFALIRNILSFIFSFIVSILVVLVVSLW